MAHDDASDRYSVGLRFLRMSWQAVNSNPVPKILSSLLRELADACEETTLLALYDPQRLEMTFVDGIESKHPLRYVIQRNQSMPLHAGASGLAILAFLPESDRACLLNSEPLKAVTKCTITDPGALKHELAKIQELGYSQTHGHRVSGAIGNAAPIFDPESNVIGSLLVTIPQQRFTNEIETMTVALVKEYAYRCTELLSGHGNSASTSNTFPRNNNISY